MTHPPKFPPFRELREGGNGPWPELLVLALALLAAAVAYGALR